ncbi:DsbA family protein [Henriciella aquimarina]|uniref:DsbA family protein n=1 Tax=Henriciella aquimarina TaxID=545261 RepID=UPI0009FE75E2|nr:DsbA family protein [Henriciella aquimarina]
MKILSMFAAVLVALALAGAAPVAAQTGGSNEAASENGQKSDAERIRDAIQNDPLAPTIEPENHDVTIVMFTDYQCPYCRRMHSTLQELLKEDDKVKLVYRDWPIFGGASDRAAKAAIASQYQGKYAAFNDALMRATGKLSSRAIRDAADEAGVDWVQLQVDMKAHEDEIDALLDRSRKQAALLGFTGTPGLLIGPFRIAGALDAENLREAVKAARGENASD